MSHLDPLRRMNARWGHGLCEVLKVESRAECASSGHATKRRAGVQTPIDAERWTSSWPLLPVQSCFSKPSWATRLNASVATVLSRRGAVKPQVQREQHQPVNVSSSIQIMRRFIGCAQFEFRRKDGLPRETRGRNTQDNSSAERSPCPRRRQSPTKSRRGKVTKVLHPVWQQDINASTSCATP